MRLRKHARLSVTSLRKRTGGEREGWGREGERWAGRETEREGGQVTFLFIVVVQLRYSLVTLRITVLSAQRVC